MVEHRVNDEGRETAERHNRNHADENIPQLDYFYVEGKEKEQQREHEKDCQRDVWVRHEFVADKGEHERKNHGSCRHGRQEDRGLYPAVAEYRQHAHERGGQNYQIIEKVKNQINHCAIPLRAFF